MTVDATGAGPSLMQRLRDETGEHHRRAESRPIEQAMVRGSLPRGLYIDVLKQRFLIHRALEARIASLLEERPELSEVIRPELLHEGNARRDLAHFGVTPESCEPRSATLRLIGEIERLARERPLALLGVYYVFEGSKNGGRFIARALRAAYGLEPGPGTLYFDPHGDAQRPLWETFKQRMNALAFLPEDQDAMVAAAQLTFECIAALDDELAPVSAPQ